MARGRKKVNSDLVLKSLTPAQLTGLMRTSVAQMLGITLDPTYSDDKAEEIVRNLGKHNVWLVGAIRAIQRNIIMPTLRVYRIKDEETVEKPEYTGLLANPNPFMDSNKFLKFMAFNYLMAGDGYALKLRMPSGKLAGLLPFNSLDIEPDPNTERTAVIYRLRSQGKTVNASDMLHWMDSDWGSSYIQGFGLASHLPYTLTLGNNADRYNVKSFENGGELKGVLTSDQPLTETDITMYLELLKKRYGGADNAGKTAVFGKGITYQRTGQSNAEMGFESLKRITREEVISVTRVPPIELGIYDNANYSNVQIQRKLFWETGLVPLLESLAGVLTKQIIRDEFKDTEHAFFFDTSAIPALQEDLTSKMSTALTMQTVGYSNEQIGRILAIEPPEYESSFAPAPAPVEPAPVKAVTANIVIEKAVDHEELRQMFLKAHGINEVPFRNALERWVIGQRNAYLDWLKTLPQPKALEDSIIQAINQYFKETKGKDIKDLNAISIPAFTRVNQTAVKQMLEKYKLEWSQGASSLMTINNHATRLQIVDDTIKEQVEAAVRQAVQDWTASGADIGSLVDSIKEASIRSYSISKKRAFTIARTETTSVANDLLHTNYTENGIGYKVWVSLIDSRTREQAGHNHVAADGEIVGVNERFKRSGTSMMYPGDMIHGSAADVCNCRCITRPETRKE